MTTTNSGEPATPTAGSFVEVLRRRAADQPDERAFTWLAEGESEALAFTFADLDRRARAIAVTLREQGLSGERMLLLFPPGLDFIAAFFGCLYAGVVAVPAYPPMQARHVGRVGSIARDCTPRGVLSIGPVRDASRPMLSLDPTLAWVGVDEIPTGTEARWRDPKVGGEDLAFLQYTSGSTGHPKGVMVTHANLLHNESLIQHSAGTDAGSTFVGWLPLYHDMGLIGNVLHPVYVGSRCILMSPSAFLERPLRWIEAVSRYRAQVSGGPNFAYDLCARRVTPAELGALDLTSWRVAFNGAEPVRAETMDRFAEVFGVAGFSSGSHFPCYGLAEATLLVTGGSNRRAEVRSTLLRRGVVAEGNPEDSRTHVACGAPRADQGVVIVDVASRQRCEPNAVGEIWTRSDSIAKGYWGRAAESEQTFSATLAGEGEEGGSYLRTGDLGFLRHGELFVTGRLKDLVIVRGRNHYPQDLEATAERSHLDVRLGCCAAFSVDAGGEERLVIVLECRESSPFEPIAAAVRRAVAEEHDVHVHTVVALAPRTVPKTSSGKIQRRECRDAFLAGEFIEIGRVVSAVEAPAPSALDRGERHSILRLDRELCDQRVEDLVAAEVAFALRIDPNGMDRTVPLVTFGLDSMVALDVADRLETRLGVALDSSVLWQRATVAEIARFVQERWVREAVFSDAEAAVSAPTDIEFDV